MTKPVGNKTNHPLGSKNWTDPWSHQRAELNALRTAACEAFMRGDDEQFGITSELLRRLVVDVRAKNRGAQTPSALATLHKGREAYNIKRLELKALLNDKPKPTSIVQRSEDPRIHNPSSDPNKPKVEPQPPKALEGGVLLRPEDNCPGVLPTAGES